MDRVFKAARAAGIGNDINPMRVRLDRQARAANPSKQANPTPAETPAAPESKPRVRVKANSRLATENLTQKIIRAHRQGNLRMEDGPINQVAASSSTHGTGNIDTFDPLLFHKKLQRRKAKPNS